ncbi:Maf family protein [Ruminococcaceae bacterium OttesenSCG-928-I18]|nr:Maf family protein [Ruminococcaceae bacterium OttesenSCG-928-I18]
MPLLLASQSPRRRALLSMLTEDFTVRAADIKESGYHAASPKELTLVLAKAKAEGVFRECPGETVIGCDTIVELEGRVLGKPADEADAIDMLSRLSGHRHQVHTGVSILYPGGCEQFTETTTVFFSTIPKNEILSVCKTPEPYDKAGAYGIQGWAARFVPRIEGCYYNAMGLPVSALYRALSCAGLL